MLARRIQPPLLVSGLIAGVACAAYYLLPKTYESTFQLVLPQVTSGMSTSLGNVDSINQGQAQFTQQLDPRVLQEQIILSNAVLSALLKDPKTPDRDKEIDRLRRSIKVTTQDLSNVLTVTVTDGSSLGFAAGTPQGAKAKASLLLSSYRKRIDQLRQSDVQERMTLYNEPVREAAVNLEKAETELGRFKVRSGLIASDDQVRASLNAMGTMVNSQANALASQKEAEARLQTLASRLGMKPADAIRSLRLASYAPYVAVRTQLDEVERSLSNARALFTDENPRVKDLLSRRTELQELVKRRVTEVAGEKAEGSLDTTRQDLIGRMIVAEAEADAMREGARNLERRIDRMVEDVRGLGPAQVDLLRYERRLLVAETTYKALISQTQQARLDMFSRYPTIPVLDVPNLPTEPNFPKPLFLIAGAVLASALASAALLVRDRRLSPQLVEGDILALNLPILAAIPEVQPTPAVHFHRLAALMHLYPNLKVLLITSSMEGEGKTYVATNLTRAVAETGGSVLLVDADFSKNERARLRAPQLEIDLEANTVGAVVATRAGSAAYRRVDSAEELAQLLDKDRDQYELIIVDTGPIQLTTDAISLLKLVPDVLFIMRRGYVSRPLALDSLDFLRQMNTNLLGCVLNGTRNLVGDNYGSYRRSHRRRQSKSAR